MKAAPFRYVRPASLEEALAVLGEHGDDASVLAGGQSLLPMMNFRLARPHVVVDLNGLGHLDFVDRAGAGLRVGALTRHRRLERLSGEAAGRGFGLVSEAARHIGHYPIRNLGTAGGSIAHADPSAELCVLSLALDASILAVSESGTREIAAADFFLGAMSTALRPDEVLTELRLPWVPDAWAFEEVSRREGDFAIVVAAVALRRPTNGSGSVHARIALGGVASTPVRARQAEDLVVAEGLLRDEHFDAVAAAAAAEVEPHSDANAEGWYRRHLVGVLVRRCLVTAAARLDGGDGA